MAAIEPLRGFKVIDEKSHGLLNPWKNYTGNSDLGKDFFDWQRPS